MIVLLSSSLLAFASEQRALYFFNGKEIIHQKRIVVETMSILNQVFLESPFYQSSGWSFFTVPSEMELVFNEGLGTLCHFKYANGSYAWALHDSNVLPRGIYALYKDKPVSFSLRGVITSPACYLFAFGQVKKSEFLQLGILDQDLLPQDSSAIYNYCYVADLTTISLSRVCDINNSLLQDADGNFWIIQILSVVLPRDDGEGYLSEILSVDQAKISKRALRGGQLFGLVFKKTAFNIPK